MITVIVSAVGPKSKSSNARAGGGGERGLPKTVTIAHENHRKWLKRKSDSPGGSKEWRCGFREQEDLGGEVERKESCEK